MELVIQSTSVLIRIHTVGKICGPSECLCLQKLKNVGHTESNRRRSQTKKIKYRRSSFTKARLLPTLTDCFISIHPNVILVSLAWSSKQVFCTRFSFKILCTFVSNPSIPYLCRSQWRKFFTSIITFLFPNHFLSMLLLYGPTLLGSCLQTV
jgi:hypothetical protein